MDIGDKYYDEWNSGWSSAQDDWNDEIPYNEDEFYRPLNWSDMQIEMWVQGYYDFWKSKNFKL